MIAAKIKLEDGQELHLDGEQFTFLILAWLMAVSASHPGKDMLGIVSTGMLAQHHENEMTQESCAAMQRQFDGILESVFSPDQIRQLAIASNVRAHVITEPEQIEQALNEIFGGGGLTS